MGMGATKRILVLSDLHVGSLYAPWPEGGVRTDAATPTVVQPSEEQRALLECWQHMVRTVPKLDLVILNGDTIDGESPKEHGRYICAPSPYDQARAAAMLLRPLREKTRDLAITFGTAYHEGTGSEAVRWLARELEAQGPFLSYTTTLGGKLIQASHHQTRGWVYLSGSVERTILFTLAAASIGRAPRVDILIRSHLHAKRIVHAYGAWGVMTPAWKLLTPYTEAKMELSRATLLSDIGAIYIEISPSGAIHIDGDTFSYNVQPRGVACKRSP